MWNYENSLQGDSVLECRVRHTIFCSVSSLVTIHKKEWSYVLLSYKVLWEDNISMLSARIIYSFPVKYIKNCHMSYGTQINPPHHAPFLGCFIITWCLPQDTSGYILLYNSTMRWLWNKPSCHICLDYRMENNMKISKLSSTESLFKSLWYDTYVFC